MADIRPFRAYRPRKGLEQIIAALPYDVYSSEEGCRAVEENPASFLAIHRPGAGFGAGGDTYGKRV